MLNDPQSISAADKASIAELTNAYPYFVVGKYLEAAVEHKQSPLSPARIALTRPYIGNWLLFSEFLERALPKKQAVADVKPAAEPAQETKPLVEPVIKETEAMETEKNEPLIQPVYTEDYFRHEGVQVSEEIPADIEELGKANADEEDKSLMVMMSFTEWLTYFKTKKKKDEEEKEDQKALKTMWQKEKLAAALEEENDEIPEDVFKMAVDSITKEDDLASESLAEIHYKQGKYDKAIDMYRKLSLRNPQKKIYFARRIEEILKEKQS
jgi:tetratricopeptide (TPR) repeat protein